MDDREREEQRAEERRYAEQSRLTDIAEQMPQRFHEVMHKLGMFGHAMSCGGPKTQEAAFNELLDAVTEMTQSWNARQELTGKGHDIPWVDLSDGD